MQDIRARVSHPLPVNEPSVGVDRHQVKHPQYVEAVDAIGQDIGKQRVPVPCLRDLGTKGTDVEMNTLRRKHKPVESRDNDCDVLAFARLLPPALAQGLKEAPLVSSTGLRTAVVAQEDAAASMVGR